MKSAAVGRFFAHCNRKSLAAANTQSRFSASNTVLLTCVIGNPPAPTSYLLTGFPCNGELSSRRIAPLRRGLTRTAPFRVGLAAFFCLPILPEGVRNRRVLRYLNIQFYRRKSSVGYLRTGRVYTLLDNSLQFDSILPILSVFCNTFLKKSRK